MSKLSKLFRHFDIAIPIRRNVEIVSTCQNCQNSDWSIILTCWNLSKSMKITTNDRREMDYSSLERSHRAESNGGKIMSLRSIFDDQLWKMLTIRHLTFTLLRHFTFCTIPTDWVIRKLWIIARWNRLNETSRMVVNSYSYEIYMAWNYAKHQKIGISFYVTAPFYVLHNSYGLSDQKIMKHSSLESSQRDESNGGKFVFVRDIYGSELCKT